MVESRTAQNIEYDHLLGELHKLYLAQRAAVSIFNRSTEKLYFEAKNTYYNYRL